MVVKGNMGKDLEYYANLPYTILVEQWDNGKGQYWVARVAELPHCLIHGDTPEEAVKEIEDAKSEWLKSNLKAGLPIPEPKAAAIARLEDEIDISESLADIANDKE